MHGSMGGGRKPAPVGKSARSQAPLAYPTNLGDDGKWVSMGAGAIVPLTEVSAIYLSEDPTEAPVEDAEETVPEDGVGSQ
jgi:hypothetical protein